MGYQLNVLQQHSAKCANPLERPAVENIPEVYEYRDRLLAGILDTILEPGFTINSDCVFSGRAGLAYALLQHDVSAEKLKEHKFKSLEDALSFFLSSTVSWGQIHRQQCSLMHGRLGILTVATLTRWREGNADENVFKELREIEELYKIPAGVHKGYELGEGCTWGREMSAYTIKHLKACATNKPFATTLLRTSHPRVTLPLLAQQGDNKDTEYVLGGCEGLMGILYVLMAVSEAIKVDWIEDVEASIDCVLTMETSTADMPRDIGHDDEREPETSFLTGSAAAVLMLCKAAEVFPHKKSDFLRAAVRLGETCWTRGIRINESSSVQIDVYRGLTGNGFALLRLFEATRDGKWLHRAQQFALLLKETLGPVPIWPSRNTSLAPAPPGSTWPLGLYDGIAGVMCYFTACEKSYHLTDEEYKGVIPNVPFFDL
eukprot:GEMP01039648.1.p1 GENE.GEMP01039648.1~~GEMP01039648.1.p1  ORF type:complete len:431 (+),score=62.89 GEMP01039648.1:117-1409(+)